MRLKIYENYFSKSAKAPDLLGRYRSAGIAEYYMGNQKDRPAGHSTHKYLVGVKNLWGKVVQAAPLDENGQRVNIVQTNPLFNADVSVSDLERLGLGMLEADTRLDFPITKTPETAALRQLFDGKKVHVMIDGDWRYACTRRRQTWDGTPNPFGHRNGYTGVATPQEVFWYHSEKGPVPTHSFFMTMTPDRAGAPQTAANFIDAIKTFGRCGSKAAKWGVAPASLPAGNNSSLIAVGKPSPPPSVAVK